MSNKMVQRIADSMEKDQALRSSGKEYLWETSDKLDAADRLLKFRTTMPLARLVAPRFIVGSSSPIHRGSAQSFGKEGRYDVPRPEDKKLTISGDKDGCPFL